MMPAAKVTMINQNPKFDEYEQMASFENVISI